MPKPVEKPEQTTDRPKRAWEPPRIKTGQLFESNSLSCGKSTPMMEPCVQNPQSS